MRDLYEIIERVGRRRLARRGFVSRFIGPPGARLHVYDAPGRGDGPPLLMLHGIGTNATAAGELMVRLQRRFSRIIAPDLPGHGFSDDPAEIPPGRGYANSVVPRLDALLDALLGPGVPVMVIGHSMGGAVSLIYTLARPDRVQALVLRSPAGAPLAPDELVALRELFSMKRMRDGLGLIDRLFAERPRGRLILGHLVLRRLGTPVVEALIDGIDEHTFLRPEEAARLQPPTLLMWGDRERILPASCLAWFRAHLPPHVEISEPPGHGHSAHLERCADLSRRIVDFADRLSSPVAGELFRTSG